MKNSRNKRRPYVVAMMLGTALSTLGAAPAPAAQVPAETAQAITDISKYCTACWRNARLDPDCWQDCTQEVFCRLLDRISSDDWGRILASDGEERKELVRAIDTVKKRTQRVRKYAPLPDIADRRDPRPSDDWTTIRQAALAALSPRQRDILDLSVAGWSVHDIAKELSTSPARVSDEKYKAVHKLRSRLSPTA
jgi:RNA polymerase sigma factor (sigma-70 family)